VTHGPVFGWPPASLRGIATGPRAKSSVRTFKVAYPSTEDQARISPNTLGLSVGAAYPKNLQKMAQKNARDRSVRFAGALLLTSLVGVAPRARANDWPSLGLDVARARATDEKSGAPFVPAWNANPGGAAIVSSPAVVDGFIVVADKSGGVSALRAVDGTSAWSVQAPGAVAASPTIDGGRVYLPNLSGTLQALRLGTGAEAWRQPFGGQNYGSPLVVNDAAGTSLVVAAGFPQLKVVRLSAATGVSQWETAPAAVADLVNSSPALGAGQVMLGMNGGRTQSLNVLTGATAWTSDATGMGGLSAPLVVGATAYSMPGGAATALYAMNASTGQLLDGWPLTVNDPTAPVAATVATTRHIVSSPAFVGGLVVFTSRVEYDLVPDASGAPGLHLLRESVVAVDPAARTVAWQQLIGSKDVASPNDIPELRLTPTPASFATEGSPLIAVASTLAPELTVLDLSGKQVWSASLSSPTRSSPVFANGLLIVATDTGVVHAFSSGVNHAPVAPTTGFDPADGQMLEGPAPTLKWAAATDAEGQPLTYAVRVFADGGSLYESPLAELDTPAGTTFATLSNGLLSAGATYHYAVRARDDQGAWSDWSPPHTFIMALTAKVSVAGQPFDTLAGAIASLPATGGVVDIGRGVQHLTSPLQLPAGVTLSGVSASDSILDATGVTAGVQITSAGHSGAPALKNLTVMGAEVGVDVVDVQNAVLRNVVVRDNHKAGVQVEEGAGAEAINVTLTRDGLGAFVSGKLSIHSSLVVGNDTGLAQSGQGLVTSRYNDVFGNKTADYQGATGGTGDLGVAVAFKSTADFHLAGFQPTTDHGDPGDAYGLEPQPNGARVNMGAFGNTDTAELSQTLAASSPVVSSPKQPVPETASPLGDTPTTAPGGGGSGCNVGGSGSRGSVSLLLSAVAIVIARRRRR
jgi:outer membrane protein assembly factor BamB